MMLLVIRVEICTAHVQNCCIYIYVQQVKQQCTHMTCAISYLFSNALLFNFVMYNEFGLSATLYRGASNLATLSEFQNAL